MLHFIDVLQPSSFEGCRGPDQTYMGISCNSCCIPEGTDCIKKKSQIHEMRWYNIYQFLRDQACPNNCPKCASCLLSDEDSLMSLKPPKQCNPSDCTTMQIHVDPCHDPDSCECFCKKVNVLTEKCPDTKPDWLPKTHIDG